MADDGCRTGDDGCEVRSGGCGDGENGETMPEVSQGRIVGLDSDRVIDDSTNDKIGILSHEGMDATDRPYQGACDRQSLPSGVKMRENVQNEANPESTQSSFPLEVESYSPEPPGRKRSQREGANAARTRLHAPRLTATVASQFGGRGGRRVTPGGCGEGEHERVVSSQWSVVSESGGGEGRAASGDSEDGEPERSEPTQEECRAPQNVQNEAKDSSPQRFEV